MDIKQSIKLSDFGYFSSIVMYIYFFFFHFKLYALYLTATRAYKSTFAHWHQTKRAIFELPNCNRYIRVTR